MVFTCDFCNKDISECCTLYFGFDCICCSNHCRSQVIQLNLQIDPKMNSPHTWLIHKLRAEKNKANTKNELLPKPKSLTELLRQLVM
jgi:hypothetical protein